MSIKLVPPSPRAIKLPGERPRGITWLGALNLLAAKGKIRIYEGTVPAHVKAKRRAANRVARRSRRANRNR